MFKWRRETFCAAGFPKVGVKALPHAEVVINDVIYDALVDTGCSQTIIHKGLVDDYSPGSGEVVAVDGSRVSISGQTCLKMRFLNQFVSVRCIVMDKMLNGAKIIIGMDVITLIGGICVDSSGKVSPNMLCADVSNEYYSNGISCVSAESEDVAEVDVKSSDEVLVVEDVDFTATFDGTKWLVRWKWNSGDPPALSTNTPNYPISSEHQKAFDNEIQEWIKLGWLEPFNESPKAVIPLLSVYQAYKDKVRPVLDYRQLNKHLSSHTADSVVCQESLRNWRTFGNNIKMLDLEKAYLQIHVEKELCQWQCVKYKGTTYALTRLGFGLCSAPRIMSAIVNKVLSLDDDMQTGTSSYIDDIIVNENFVKAEDVASHLLKYGLKCKVPVKLDGARVLGLQVTKSQNHKYVWTRGNTISDVKSPITKRQVFALCGQLVGHYPVAGWLRVSCGYLKRLCSEGNWDEKVNDDVETLVNDVMSRLSKDDPVKGVWEVNPCDEAKIWCDASNLAIGVVIEVNNVVIEDAAWLRKKDDCQHINVAELEAIIKGANLAEKWNFEKLTFVTDSQTVFKWVKSVISRDCKIRTHGLSEILIKRRLEIIKEIIEQHFKNFDIVLVESKRNKADILTRVKRDWLSQVKLGQECCAVMSNNDRMIREVHSNGHMGIEKTLSLVKTIDEGVSKEEVECVVKDCPQCLSIDPNPIRWKHGSLEVDTNWCRLACDITHFCGKKYLTIIDCGPSRHIIWREVSEESDRCVCKEIEQIYREYGSPTEFLVDNGAVFKSRRLNSLLKDWGVRVIYRCAFRPEGNGIVERSHRTIKRMASRSDRNPLDMVYWWNAVASIQRNNVSIFNHQWRVEGRLGKVPDASSVEHSNLRIGQAVLVKPGKGRCTTQWTRGQVTKINSEVNIEVDGVPRHISDIRPFSHSNQLSTEVQEVPVHLSQHDRIPVLLQEEIQLCEDSDDESTFPCDSSFSDSISSSVNDNVVNDSALDNFRPKRNVSVPLRYLD